MEKSLSKMTLEELWQLFPITLTAPNSAWRQWFLQEKDELVRLLGENICVHHIGSTAIAGIRAKPIVDILVELSDGQALNHAVCILRGSGYLLMNQRDGRASLNKGYTPHGYAERVFHVHLRISGDADELLFRDYLNENGWAAKEYERLKLRLWKQFEHDRDGYTNAKSPFVADILALAKNSDTLA